VVMCVVWERGSQRGQGNGSTYSKRGWMGGGDKHVQVHLLLWFRGRATREAKVIGPPIFLRGGLMNAAQRVLFGNLTTLG